MGRHSEWKRLGKVCGGPQRVALEMRAPLGATPSRLASSISLQEASKGADPRAPLPNSTVGRLCWGSALICEDPEHDLNFLTPSQVWRQVRGGRGDTKHVFAYWFGTTTKNTHKRNKKTTKVKENLERHVEICLLRNLESIVKFQSSKTSKVCWIFFLPVIPSLTAQCAYVSKIF